MADQKISQLSSGGAAQATDDYVIARSGANYKVSGANVAAAATSVGTLSSLTVSGTTTVSGGGASATPYLTANGLRLSGGDANNSIWNDTRQLSITNSNSFIYLAPTSSGGTQGLAVNTTNGNVTAYNALTVSGDLTVDTNTLKVDSANNRVGIGTASPAELLHVEASAAVAQIRSTSTTAGNAPRLRFNHAGNDSFDLRGGDGLSFLASATTEVMRLTSSGNLGLGVTPSYRLHAVRSGDGITAGIAGGTYGIRFDNGGTFSSGMSTIHGVDSTLTGSYQPIMLNGSDVRLGTGGTERARITSGGYFKASDDGTYNGSTSSYHELRNSANVPTVVITNTNASFTDDFLFANVTATAAGTGFNLLRLRSSSVDQFRVRGDGTIYAQNTTVQSISDARLKENISDATDGLDVITALRPVRYDWKAGYGNDRTNQLGFIAQEVEAVFPEAVSEWSMDEPTGEVDEDGKPITEKVDYKTVGPGALIPVLVKAIQELEARIAALEAGA